MGGVAIAPSGNSRRGAPCHAPPRVEQRDVDFHMKAIVSSDPLSSRSSSPQRTSSDEAVPDEHSFGPYEGFVCAWRRALLSPTLLLELAVVGVMAGVPEFVLPQHTRPVPAQHMNGSRWARAWMLNSPRVPETVSNLSLWFIFCTVPIGAALVLSLFSPARGAVKAWLHSYLWTMGTQAMVVGGLKGYCGYWRPYFLDECAFNDATGGCTSTDSYTDAFRSFPSAHASGAVAALLHTSLRLLGALRVGYIPCTIPLGQGGHALELDGLLTMLCLGPTFVAAWVAGSRVHDNAHHPADVVGGALVGGGAAVLWYLRYFHAPFGPHSHRARIAERLTA